MDNIAFMSAARTSRKLSDISGSITDTIKAYRELGSNFGYSFGTLIAEMLEHYREKVQPANIWLLKVNGQHGEEDNQMRVGFFSCLRQASQLVKDGEARTKPQEYGHVLCSLLYKSPQEKPTLNDVDPIAEFMEYSKQWDLNRAVELIRPLLHGLSLMEKSNLKLIFVSRGLKDTKDNSFFALWSNDEGSEYYEIKIDGQILADEFAALRT